MPRHKAARLTRESLGFLLAKATQRWNEMLHRSFSEHGFAHVRPSFGSILIPLFEQDGLRLGELAQRGGVSKQTMTTLVREVEEAGLVRRRPDSEDARASRVRLTEAARRFEPVAERVLSDLDRQAAAVAGADEAMRAARWLQRFVKG